jgi:hypothetical protein
MRFVYRDLLRVRAGSRADWQIVEKYHAYVQIGTVKPGRQGRQGIGRIDRIQGRLV